jgi:predicted HicB family RNase H-like nuclease
MSFSDKAKASQYIYGYTKDNYDRISLMVSKGDKDKYKALADAAGQSLNAWIVEAMEEKRAKAKK